MESIRGAGGNGSRWNYIDRPRNARSAVECRWLIVVLWLYVQLLLFLLKLKQSALKFELLLLVLKLNTHLMDLFLFPGYTIRGSRSGSGR